MLRFIKANVTEAAARSALLHESVTTAMMNPMHAEINVPGQATTTTAANSAPHPPAATATATAATTAKSYAKAAATPAAKPTAKPASKPASKPAPATPQSKSAATAVPISPRKPAAGSAVPVSPRKPAAATAPSKPAATPAASADTVTPNSTTGGVPDDIHSFPYLISFFDHCVVVPHYSILSSKTTGEPPYVLASSVFLALWHAVSCPFNITE